MGQAPSEPMELFDQKKWVDDHANELKGKSVQQVFQYVTSYHPNMGCALLGICIPRPLTKK